MTITHRRFCRFLDDNFKNLFPTLLAVTTAYSILCKCTGNRILSIFLLGLTHIRGVHAFYRIYLLSLMMD